MKRLGASGGWVETSVVLSGLTLCIDLTKNMGSLDACRLIRRTFLLDTTGDTPGWLRVVVKIIRA
jgi:hypothetical protein